MLDEVPGGPACASSVGLCSLCAPFFDVDEEQFRIKTKTAGVFWHGVFVRFCLVCFRGKTANVLLVPEGSVTLQPVCKQASKIFFF